MKNPDFWKNHYVVETDVNEIERSLQVLSFASDGEMFELPYFESAKNALNIVISPGSGGHSYVFAELAYQMYLTGYNVFIMPKHGGYTLSQILQRHTDALKHITATFTESVGVYGEGLGGYVTFYLALAHAPVKSIVCQNSPAIVTERAYHQALVNDSGPWAGAARRRKVLIPLAKLLVRIFPNVKLPISSYLDWQVLIDTNEESRSLETRLVVEGYLNDVDFDKWYPLSAIMSMISTLPPNPLEELNIPTMFLLDLKGPTPSYIKELYSRLPPVTKRLIEIDGSVYWMLSHPHNAAKIISEWFSVSLMP